MRHKPVSKGNRIHVLPFRYTVATIIKATYARDVTSNDDDYIVLAEEAGRYVVGEDAPGTMLVDFLPLREF